MRKRVSFIVAFALLAICLIAPAAVEAEAPYRYHNIPFDATTADEVEQILVEEFGRATKNDYGMYLIEDYGYNFDMDVDFRGRKGVERFVLHRSGNGYAEGDAFRLLVQQDIEQFMDMENQLIQQYGQPDFRFFYTRKENTNIWTRFMFPDSDWNEKRLMEVYKSNQYIDAHSVWNNVTLEVWSNGLDKRNRGYLSKLSLQFTDQSEWKETPVMTEYQPVE